jgi:hypothetical protein
MLSELRSYRKKLEAKRDAKDAAKKSRQKRGPRLVKNDFERHGYKWHTYSCSECDHDLHRTARFCVGCGAWFGEK